MKNKKINISDILKRSLIGINNEKVIEVESHDPVEVVEAVEAVKAVKPIADTIEATTANKTTVETPTSRRVNKGFKVAKNSWNEQISELELFFNS